MKEYFNISKIQEHTSQASELLLLLPIFIFGLIVVIAICIDNKQKNGNISISPFIIFIVIFIIAIVGYFGTMPNKDLIKLKDVYDNGNYKIVEGFVVDFDPMPYGGHKQETFNVNGIKFSYSDYGSSVGYSPVFKKTQSHGGPIYEGAYIKLFYIHDERFNDNFIIGLWIKEDWARNVN